MFSDKKYLTASQLVPPGEGGSEQYSCSGGAAEAWGVDRAMAGSPEEARSEEHLGPCPAAASPAPAKEHE